MSFSQQGLSSQELRKKAELEIEAPGYVETLEGVSEMDKTRIMARVNQIRSERERVSRIRARASNGGKKRLTKKGRKVKKRKGTKKMRKSRKNRRSRRSRK